MRFDLTEQELHELWVLQRDAIVLLSISATSMFLSLGLRFEQMARVPEEEPPLNGEFLFEVGMPLLALVAVMFAVLGFFALKRRREVLSRIDMRRRLVEEQVSRLEDSPEPGIVASAREPSRTLLRW